MELRLLTVNYRVLVLNDMSL